MTDEQTRIRGYLTAQGAKLSPAEIVEKVCAAMDQLRAAAEAVPDARFGERPAAEEWSANEVMAHVVTAGRHFGGAVVRLLDGLSGGGVRDQLERDVPRRSASEWWTTLKQDRDTLFARVRTADGRLRSRMSPTRKSNPGLSRAAHVIIADDKSIPPTETPRSCR